MGAGPKTVVYTVWVRIRVPPLLLGSQSIQAKSSVGCGPVKIVFVTVGPGAPLVGLSSITIPVFVTRTPAVLYTTTMGPAFVIVLAGVVV